ncbi:hypothetical protein NHX12_019422 [Muraenolepis orangiensis]|uniref:Uncharacterized protein n=1 Tax=Muraenolepis orangiensis TaxID=630683 RepID=A0A9Q0ETL9_9TELE|nr:hypothetical protein NHX12_019422 [Muraenolepis orangiensis]
MALRLTPSGVLSSAEEKDPPTDGYLWPRVVTTRAAGLEFQETRGPRPVRRPLGVGNTVRTNINTHRGDRRTDAVRDWRSKWRTDRSTRQGGGARPCGGRQGALLLHQVHI